MTLTELSYYLRKALPLVLIFTLLLFIFYYSIKLIFLLSQKPVERITYINPIFDKIERPYFKEATLSAGLNFVLDTIEGKPITATDTAKVFFIPEPQPRLTYRTQLLLMAKQFGFDTNLTKYQLEGDEAVFTEGRKDLRINIKNFNFSYKYDFSSEGERFSSYTLPSNSEIENRAIDFLKSVDRYPDSLAKGETKIIYFLYQPESNLIKPTENKNEANVAEINFYSQSIDELGVVYDKFLSSPNHLIVTFDEREMKILKARISYFKKMEDQYGIYPLKTGEEAYEELVSGNGFVVANLAKGNKITLTKMFLAYYEPSFYQPYFQPVYVFVGKDDFVAYVPAVKNDYLK